jgi:membrane protease YdiL (CAAX protease family)
MMTLPSDEESFGGEGAARPRGPWSHVKWGVKEIVTGGVAILLSLFLVIGLAQVLIWLGGFESESAEGLAVQLLVSVAWDGLILLTVYRLVRSKGGSWRDLGLRPPHRGFFRFSPMSSVFWGIPIAYLVAIAVVNIYGISLKALGLEDLLPGQQLSDDIFEHDALLLAMAFAGVTIVPFAEELFFRGFFFAGLRPRLSFVLSGLISGFFFSLAHADPGLIIPFTGVGVILAYTYERTGSLWAPIGVHMLFNSVSFLILILVPEAR